MVLHSLLLLVEGTKRGPELVSGTPLQVVLRRAYFSQKLALSLLPSWVVTVTTQ